MEQINKFRSFLGSDLAYILPPELAGEIGQRYFWEFKSEGGVTYDDLFEISTYLSFLYLGENKKIVALPPDLPNLRGLSLLIEAIESLPPNLPNLQELSLGYNNMIESLPPDLPNLKTLILGYNDKIVSLPPDLTNLQILDLGYNNTIESLPPDLPNLQILRLGSNESIASLPPDLPNLQFLELGWNKNNNIDSNTLRIKYPNLQISQY